MKSHSAKQGLDFIKVLHVENDPSFREVIADQLSDHGFAVHSFADAMSLPAGLAASPDTDIILLDWPLPDMPGIVCSRRCAKPALACRSCS